MERKECPFCGERIQKDALKCRYCREWLSEQGRELSQHDIQPEEQNEILPTPVEDITPTAIEEETPISENEILFIEIETAQTEDIETKEKAESQQEETINQIVFQEITPTPTIQEEKEDNNIEVEQEEITTELEVAPAIEEIIPAAKREIEEEEEELIRWQNFKTNKILAILAFILSCIATYFSYFEINDELTIRSVFLVFITVALDTYLYYQLYLYLRNFDIFYELQNTMKLMLGCYITSLIGIVVFFALYHYENMVWLVIPVMCILFISIIWLIVGWKLWKRTDDFVGGLETFGLITFLAVFIPGLGTITPLLLYKVFANAQEHIEDNGYLDDNEDDY